MKKIVRLLAVVLALLIAAVPASAQFYPDPVDLGINNEEQKIEEWFWPALIRQIMLKGVPQPPPPTQCQIASLANPNGFPETDCCLEPLPEECKRPLEPAEVLKILGQAGIQVQEAERPKTAEEIYQHLVGGRALLVGFFIAENKKHAYLVRGIAWETDGRAMLLINDPHVTEPFRAPFDEEVPGWQTVMTVQLPMGDPSEAP